MKKCFLAPYTVTIGDINYGRHLGNERPFIVFQDARIRFLKLLGFSEGNIGDNTAIVIVESGCRYLRQVFLHEELEIKVAIDEIEGKRCKLAYSAVRKEDGQEVFTGFTVMLAFDPKEGKVVGLPIPFLESCRKWQQM